MSNLALVYLLLLDMSSREKSILVFLAGCSILCLSKVVESLGRTFQYLPPKLHMGIIVGICCIVIAEVTG